MSSIQTIMKLQTVRRIQSMKCSNTTGAVLKPNSILVNWYSPRVSRMLYISARIRMFWNAALRSIRENCLAPSHVKV